MNDEEIDEIKRRLLNAAGQLRLTDPNGHLPSLQILVGNDAPKLVEEVERLRRQAEGLCERIAAQSELLSRRAEK